MHHLYRFYYIIALQIFQLIFYSKIKVSVQTLYVLENRKMTAVKRIIFAQLF